MDKVNYSRAVEVLRMNDGVDGEETNEQREPLRLLFSFQDDYTAFCVEIIKGDKRLIVSGHVKL